MSFRLRPQRWLHVPTHLRDRAQILGTIPVQRIRVDEWWFEGRIDEHWTVAYRMSAQHGSPVICEVRVFPSEPDDPYRQPGEWSGTFLGHAAHVPAGGITARLLKRLRPGDTHSSDIAEGRAAWERFIGLGPGIAQHFERAGLNVKRLKKPRARKGKWSDAELLDAAVFYVQQGGRYPVVALAHARMLTRAQARDLLQAASRKSLLTAGRPGVKSRQLTELARQMLTTTKKTTTKKTKTRTT